MSITRGWVGVPEDELLGSALLREDALSFVPEPLGAAEVAEVEALLAAQEAARSAASDPARMEYWEVAAEVEATLAGEEPTGWAGEELQAGLSAASRGLGRAGLTAQETVHVVDATLAASVEAVGRLRSQLDGVLTALVLDGARRGLHTAVGMGLVDWVRVRCPWMSLTEASHLRAVVDAAATHWGGQLADAVVTGRTGLHRAAKVATTITRLASSLAPDQREAYAAIVTAAASNPAISDRDLARACTKLLIDLLDEPPDRRGARGDDGPEGGKDDDGDDRGDGDEHGAESTGGSRARELRWVSRRPLGNGMTRYTVDAPDDDAAILDGILTGVLARPCPGEDGLPDPRPAGARRYDALMAVVGRGLGHPGAPPSAARASVIITVRADPATGRPQGAACTQTGQVLTASQAGRFACTGDLTPVVLGEHDEPLRLGRTQRLASAGQFKALVVRDEGCVYPGCTVPATWCEAHHTVWWCRGGPTDIDTLALLCPRHHTHVHDRNVQVTVTGGYATVHV